MSNALSDDMILEYHSPMLQHSRRIHDGTIPADRCVISEACVPYLVFPLLLELGGPREGKGRYSVLSLALCQRARQYLTNLSGKAKSGWYYPKRLGAN